MSNKGKDILPTAKYNFEWCPSKVNASLQALYEVIHQDAVDVMSWYLRRKSRKKLGARALRVGTIIAGTAATIAPIVAQMYTSNGEPFFPPAWASVFLAGAAAFALLDRYFGLSNGWTRYMRTELEIRQLTSEFQLWWEVAKAKLGNEPPTPQQLDSTLNAFKKFVVAMHQVVRRETELWIKEFETVISIIDKKKQ